MLSLFWYGLVVVFLVICLLILYFENNKKKYLLYFLGGAVFGFYFDVISVSQGYYAYFPFKPVLFGVPLSVTFAEGLAVLITIYGFEKVQSFLKKHKKLKKASRNSNF
ncbi:MAG: hypothetical protein KKF89_02615 [Nanoarchaeota archaeon]|nr:hypothetical protein [Nanoarchaeota archaeon]MBU1854587.1 hypothetical protein [Nanoarchaeota archaeon]